MDNGRLAYRVERDFYDFGNGWGLVAECIIEHATGIRIVSVRYRTEPYFPTRPIHQYDCDAPAKNLELA